MSQDPDGPTQILLQSIDPDVFVFSGTQEGAADGENDDWLFNSQGDDPTVAPWVPPWDDDDTTAGIPPMPELYYVRLSTLARVRTPDRTYLGPTVDPIENSIAAPLNTREERLHRRQLLQTIIDLRNL